MQRRLFKGVGFGYFKKLSSKKKYYVRIRAYKKSGGKTYYSSWSSAKSIKTK